MRLEPIAQWLQTKGVGVIGQTIFVNFIPADVDGILLRQDLAGTRKDPELPGWVRAPFLLIARAKSYGAADALSKAAETALKQIAGQTIDGVTYRRAYAARYPFPYSPSPSQSVELTTTYMTAHVDTSA